MSGSGSGSELRSAWGTSTAPGVDRRSQLRSATDPDIMSTNAPLRAGGGNGSMRTRLEQQFGSPATGPRSSSSLVVPARRWPPSSLLSPPPPQQAPTHSTAASAGLPVCTSDVLLKRSDFGIALGTAMISTVLLLLLRPKFIRVTKSSTGPGGEEDDTDEDGGDESGEIDVAKLGWVSVAALLGTLAIPVAIRTLKPSR